MRYIKALIIAVALLSLTTAGSAQEFSILNILWNNSVKGAVGMTTLVDMYVKDINNDGFGESVVITSGSAGSSETMNRNRIIAFYGNGSIYWDYKVDDVIRDEIMYDINNDGKQEFVISSGQELNKIQRGSIRIIDSEGELLRSYDSTSIMKSLYLTDISRDRYYQILGGSTMRVFLFQIYGEKLWMYPPEGGGSMPAPADVVTAGDVDRDGLTEMVIGADKVYYLRHDGVLIKSYDVEPNETFLKKGFKFIKVMDWVGKEDQKVVAITKNNVIHTIDVFGIDSGYYEDGYHKEYLEINESWSLPIESDISTIVNYDLDGDGLAEFILGCSNGVVYTVDNTGYRMWDYPVNGNADSIALGDIDEDNVSDIVVGTYAGTIYALDLKGHIKWKHDTLAPILRIGVGELNGDGTNEIVVVKENNAIEAYGLNRTFVLMKRADNYFRIGEEYFLNKEWQKAIDSLILAKNSYRDLDYEKGVSDSERLIREAESGKTENRRKQADEYYSKATDYFINGDYDSALASAIKAKEIYQEFGESEKVLNCELIELRIKNIKEQLGITPTTMRNITATTLSGGGAGRGIDIKMLSVGGLVVIVVIIILFIRKKRGEGEEELISDTVEKPKESV